MTLLLDLGISPDLEKIFRVLFILVVAIIGYKIIFKNIEKTFIRKVTGRNVTNVRIFFNLLNYIFFFLLILFLIFVYAGSLTGFGISAGLLTAAIGWALQKPITGVAAWIMVATKRPFKIGDRVIIGDTKGDVSDITITHIYLKECGGTVDGEEISGRTIMIPNSIMFEKNILNYTLKDPYILDEVVTLVTYESNVEKAERIVLDIANKFVKDILEEVPVEPHTRLKFQDSGINVSLRYYVLTKERNKISTDVTREILKRFNKTKDIEIAYPHIELVKKRSQ